MSKVTVVVYKVRGQAWYKGSNALAILKKERAETTGHDIHPDHVEVHVLGRGGSNR